MTRTLDLGIDTAGEDASLALMDADGRAVAERRWHVGSSMTRELLAEVDALLADAGATRVEIGRMAVDIGPGQYGALRSGIATAQGLAIALNVPLAGVNRLEADAALVLSPATPLVVAVHDARNGIAWAAYRHAPRAEVAAPALTSVEDALRRAPAGAHWTGEVTPALREALGQDADRASGDTIEAGPVAVRATALLRIARDRDAFGDPGSVDALYLRLPPITPPREQ